jgi:hypothetical protein
MEVGSIFIRATLVSERCSVPTVVVTNLKIRWWSRRDMKRGDGTKSVVLSLRIRMDSFGFSLSASHAMHGIQQEQDDDSLLIPVLFSLYMR